MIVNTFKRWRGQCDVKFIYSLIRSSFIGSLTRIGRVKGDKKIQLCDPKMRRYIVGTE